MENEKFEFLEKQRKARLQLFKIARRLEKEGIYRLEYMLHKI